jgi:hypothetical protein
MRERYKAAHRQARINASNGLWLRNPVRLVDGWPGVFVGASGRLFCVHDIWALPEELFTVIKRGEFKP